MTAYSVGFLASASTSGGTTTGNYSQNAVLRAGLFPVRILSVEHIAFGTATAAGSDALNSASTGSCSVLTYPSTAISGGVVLTPQPLRDPAPPVSCEVRHRTGTSSASGSSLTYSLGTAVSVGGTARRIKNFPADFRPPSSTATDAPAAKQQLWSPPTELVIAPGSVFALSQVLSSVTGSNQYANYSFGHWLIVFDEERVSRSA